jgi:GxxExxY protein
MQRKAIDPQLDKIARLIVDAAYQVHYKLGPGLLEQIYETCLVKELEKKKLKVSRQVPIPIFYDGEDLNLGFRLDLLVENSIIIEIKAVENLIPVHHAQVLTYLKLSQKHLGFLINFNVPIIKAGIKRIAL